LGLYWVVGVLGLVLAESYREVYVVPHVVVEVDLSQREFDLFGLFCLFECQDGTGHLDVLDLESFFLLDFAEIADRNSDVRQI
jgi:hypothetical protein